MNDVRKQAIRLMEKGVPYEMVENCFKEPVRVSFMGPFLKALVWFYGLLFLALLLTAVVA